MRNADNQVLERPILVGHNMCSMIQSWAAAQSCIFTNNRPVIIWSSLYSPELQKSYFPYNHRKICSKVPILLYFVRPKRPSDNCYISCFLTEKILCFKCVQN